MASTSPDKFAWTTLMAVLVIGYIDHTTNILNPPPEVRQAQQLSRATASVPPRRTPVPVDAGIYSILTPRERIAPLRIDTPNGYNYFIKLVSADTSAEILTAFAYGGIPIELEVPLGVYKIRYAYGKDWYGLAELFGPDTSLAEADKLFSFNRTGNEISGFTVSLILNRSGNLHTKHLSRREF
jgi:hypothetical protein